MDSDNQNNNQNDLDNNALNIPVGSAPAPEPPEKTKNKTILKVTIIISVAIVMMIALIPIINLINYFAYLSFSPTPHTLSKDEDVISYLTKNYPEEQFEVISNSKDEDGLTIWRAKSITSNTEFNVTEVYDDKPGSGGLAKAEYVPKDDYKVVAVNKILNDFNSTVFNIELDSYFFDFTLYDKNGSLLTLTEPIDPAITEDLLNICLSIQDTYPFKNDGYQFYIGLRNQSDVVLRCEPGVKTTSDLIVQTSNY